MVSMPVNDTELSLRLNLREFDFTALAYSLAIGYGRDATLAFEARDENGVPITEKQLVSDASVVNAPSHALGLAFEGPVTLGDQNTCPGTTDWGLWTVGHAPSDCRTRRALPPRAEPNAEHTQGRRL